MGNLVFSEKLRPALLSWCMKVLFAATNFFFVISGVSYVNAEDNIPNIYLKGIALGDSSPPLVIIEESSSIREQRIYHLHDFVEGFEILDIQKGRIYLKKGDNQKWITLDGSGSFDPADEQLPDQTQLLILVADQIDVKRLANQISGKVRQKSDSVVQDEMPNGITITYVEKGSLFDGLGVKPGDVLLGFNEHQLNQIEDFKVAIQQFSLNKAGVVRIAFDRNGEFQTRYGEVVE